jgi:hypothetical protein
LRICPKERGMMPCRFSSSTSPTIE